MKIPLKLVIPDTYFGYYQMSYIHPISLITKLTNLYYLILLYTYEDITDVF